MLDKPPPLIVISRTETDIREVELVPIPLITSVVEVVNISVAYGSPLSTIISDINSAICQLNAYAQYFYDGINATPPDWNTLTLINGFSNVGAGYQTAQYRKWTSGVNIGKVEVRGFIKKSAFDGTRTTFANMPVGYAPSTEQVESTSMTSNGVAPSSELLYVSNASGFEAECTVDSPVNVTFPINFDYYTS